MTANQGNPNRKRRSREEIKRLVSEFEKSGLRPASSLLLFMLAFLSFESCAKSIAF